MGVGEHLLDKSEEIALKSPMCHLWEFQRPEAVGMARQVPIISVPEVVYW